MSIRSSLLIVVGHLPQLKKITWKGIGCHDGLQEFSRCRTKRETEKSIMHKQWSMSAEEGEGGLGRE